MNVIIDTREQQPLDIEYAAAFHGEDVSITNRKLDLGDYSVEGLEDKLVIERKKSTSEICVNISAKDRDRFQRELVRLADIKYAFFLCEFPRSYIWDFPKNSTIPPKKWKGLKVNSGYLSIWMNKIENVYGIPVIYCDSKADAETAVLKILMEKSAELIGPQ